MPLREPCFERLMVLTYTKSYCVKLYLCFYTRQCHVFSVSFSYHTESYHTKSHLADTGRRKPLKRRRKRRPIWQPRRKQLRQRQRFPTFSAVFSHGKWGFIRLSNWAEVHGHHGLTCCFVSFVLWPKDEVLPWITLWVTCHRLVWWLYDKWGWFVTAPWATPESCGFRMIHRYDMSILQSPSYLHVRLKLLFCTEFLVIDDTCLYTVHLAPHTNCLNK